MKIRFTNMQKSIILGILAVLGGARVSSAQCEVAKLIGSAASAEDRVSRVAISGNLVVVGSTYDNTGGYQRGLVYIFERHEAWTETTALALPETADGDRFGASVAIDGNTVIGAWIPFEASAGAVNIYDRNFGGENNWGLAKTLFDPEGGSGEGFGLGLALALHGDTAVIGAYLHDIDGITDAGAAYVFERNLGGPGNWGLAKKLIAPDHHVSDGFGWTVAIDGDTIVVGKMLDDELGLDAGAAYVFSRNQDGPGNYGIVKKLVAGDANDWFGHTVDISGNTIAIGAVGVYDDEPGAVYLFERQLGGPENWGQSKKLLASDASPGFADQFGRGIGLDGDTLVVTAQRDNYIDDGKAYVFHRNYGGPDNWGEVHKIVPLDLATNDYFGTFADVSGSFAVIASALDDNEGGVDAGSAYIFAVAGDCDDDGVPDSDDKCPETATSATIVIDGCETGVRNVLFNCGCSMLDLIEVCQAGASNHGQFVRCVGALARDWRQDGLITSQERASIIRCVARSNFGNIPVDPKAMREAPQENLEK